MSVARWGGRAGWHEDYAGKDGTPEYRPAVQQLWSEFCHLSVVLNRHSLLGGRCLQLGIGECDASHNVWRCLFGHVVTVDFRIFVVNDEEPRDGGNTHAIGMLERARAGGPYDFLFIDAGHTLDDVRRDYLDYAPLVRRGGIIAFHDAVRRIGYPEIEVWRYLATLQEVNMIGTEVGTAWLLNR